MLIFNPILNVSKSPNIISIESDSIAGMIDH